MKKQQRAAKRKAFALQKRLGDYSPVSASYGGSAGGWYPFIGESYAGAWQRNDEIRCDTVMEAPALFACVTLIASDIAKLRARVVQLEDWGGWTPTDSAAFSPVLRKPNRYQNHIQFKEHWMLSKLTRGNTFVLKERDRRGVVTRLYVLDPDRVVVLVAPDGDVYYDLSIDNLPGIQESVTVPASEIIHDRFNTIFHPLIGLSPIYAAGLPAMQSLKIGRHWSRFFGNNAQPGGILVAPGPISQDNANGIKETWNSNYTGINAGKVAVIGDGMKYQPLSPTASDSQVIQQLQWGAETIASVFHIPAYKINVGAVPSNNNVEALDSQYYTQCLQKLIEDFELCMDEGLGIGEEAGKIDGRILGTELDIRTLLRMDTAAKVDAAVKLAGAGLGKIDELRAWFDWAPLAKGGDTPYLQQQNYSIEALAERDEAEPLSAPAVAAPAAPAAEPTPSVDETPPEDAAVKELADALIQRFMAASDVA